MRVAVGVAEDRYWTMEFDVDDASRIVFQIEFGGAPGGVGVGIFCRMATTSSRNSELPL